MFVDRDGQPVDVKVWRRLVADPDYRVLARTAVDGGGLVATYWLGFDPRWPPGSPPLVFQSHVTGGRGDGELRAYPSEREAWAGHRALVEWLTCAG